jgi:hypothetical protein
MSATLTSCFENPSYKYELAPVVEIKNPRAGFGTQPVGNVSNGVAQRTINQTLKRDSILVQLVGPAPTADLSVGYIIDSKSTAVEGINYTMIGSKGNVIIPANTNSAYIKYTVLAGIPTTIAATQNYALILTLVGNDQVKPSENYKTFTVNIRR